MRMLDTRIGDRFNLSYKRIQVIDRRFINRKDIVGEKHRINLGLRFRYLNLETKSIMWSSLEKETDTEVEVH